MRNFLILLLALSATAAAADVDQSKYLPLKPGNEWTLDVVVTSAAGKVDKALARRKQEDSEERDGKTYVRSRTSIEGPLPTQYTKLLRKDELGLHSLSEDAKDAKETTDIPLPMKKGNTWKTAVPGGSISSEVVGIEKVTIGEKTYENCFHIRAQTQDGKYREDCWEAPKFGNVKSEIALGNGVRMLLTLREFKATKP